MLSMVHPVPAPVSTSAELNNNSKLNGNSQKLILLRRGNQRCIALSCKRGLCLHLINSVTISASRVVSEDPTNGPSPSQAPQNDAHQGIK